MRSFAIPGDSVFPEGITEGPGTSFFVGSLTDGTIYRGDTATGAVEVFLPPDGDGRAAIAGLDIDDHGRLICCDFQSGQLFAYDLASRTLAARRPLPAEAPGPNDVVVHGDSAYVTDSSRPVLWHLPTGPDGVGDPEIAIDLTPYGPADPAYLNGIVCHPGRPLLLAGSQGEGGDLWRIDLTGQPPGQAAAQPDAERVDLGGYEFNADGMLLDGDVLYGVTNRGETMADARFQISAVRLAPDWRTGTVLGELADPAWDCPTTIAKVGDELLIVCAQLRAQHAGTPPSLPFIVAARAFPRWPQPA